MLLLEDTVKEFHKTIRNNIERETERLSKAMKDYKHVSLAAFIKCNGRDHVFKEYILKNWKRWDKFMERVEREKYPIEILNDIPKLIDADKDSALSMAASEVSNCTDSFTNCCQQQELKALAEFYSLIHKAYEDAKRVTEKQTQ